jgi:hypothetical protein
MLVVADPDVSSHVDFVWSDASSEGRVSFVMLDAILLGFWAACSYSKCSSFAANLHRAASQVFIQLTVSASMMVALANSNPVRI